MAEEQQDGQKTLVAFVVGLLIGGMLVWAFSGPSANAPEEEITNNDTSDETSVESQGGDAMVSDIELIDDVVPEVTKPELRVGNGQISVQNQVASDSIVLASATYPISEGWIGVRDYNNDQLGMILGVVRFSESQGLVPSEIFLQRATEAGNKYAVVVFSEDGDFKFSLADDVQIDTIFDTFVAQ